MKTNKQLHGFTLIELVVVIAIISIMVALGIATIMPTRPRMKIRGDSQNVNQALIKARMACINYNTAFGVAFYRTASGSPVFPYTYHYFIFKDSMGAMPYPPGGPDELFTDTDGNPLHQCETPTSNPPGNCTAGGEDPIWWSENRDTGRIQPRVMTLEKEVFFDTILGATLGTAPRFVIFKPPMGEATAGGDIVIQSNVRNDADQSVSYASIISIIQATGVTRRAAPTLRTHPIPP